MADDILMIVGGPASQDIQVTVNGQPLRCHRIELSIVAGGFVEATVYLAQPYLNLSSTHFALEAEEDGSQD
jgi:hypothetical protein